MSTLIQTRRDTLANWKLNNPILGDGEQIVVFMPDNSKNFKIGNGTSTFTQLPFTRDFINKLVTKGAYVAGGVQTANGKLITWQGNSGTPTTGQGNQTAYTNPSNVGFPQTETGKLIDSAIFGHDGVALFDSGNLYGWGYNGTGCLGLGHANIVYVPTLLATGVLEFRAPTSLTYSIANTRLLIKKSDNFWYGAGYNGYGQLGNASTANSSVFVKFTALGTNVKNIWNLGAEYGCVVADTGTALMMAGYNGYGQFGNGNGATQTSFLNVSTAWGYVAGTNDNVITVTGGFGYYNTAASSTSTIVILIGATGGNSGTIKTSGYNGYGQCGTGNTADRITPYSVGSGYTKVVASGGGVLTVYALTSAGTFARWGYNGYGQCGNGTGTDVLTPIIGLVNGQSVIDFYINTGGHTYPWYSQIFIKTASGLYSAGYNGHGQCGVGNLTTPINTYTSVLINEDVIDVASNGYNGNFYNLLLTSSGKVYGTGYNGLHGISMDGTTVNAQIPRNLTPFLI